MSINSIDRTIMQTNADDISFHVDNLATFFESLSFRLAGKKTFGIYQNKDEFNRLLIKKADEFISSDKGIIADPKEIEKRLVDSNAAELVLLKNSIDHYSWEYDNKKRNIMFGIAYGSDCESKHVPVYLGNIKEQDDEFDFKKTYFLSEDGMYYIDKRLISNIVKAIIPTSHKMVKECLKHSIISQLVRES